MNNFAKKVASIALGTTIIFSSVAGASAATYTVKSGDTLSAIALKYNTTYSAIMKENGLNSTLIGVGQKLQIGGATTNPTSTKSTTTKTKTTTYTVKSGDTLSRIASKYGTTYTAIMKLNGLKTTLIKVGQQLKIGGITTTSATSNNVAVGSKVVTLAQKYIGVPYVYGGSTPSGFDCSGFIYYVFNNTGKSIGRMSAAGYYNVAKKVSAPQVGDLVFFSNTYKAGISHVGIYLGNGKMISASGDKVNIETFQSGYWKTHFTGYGRI